MISPADRLNDVSEYYFSKKLQQIAEMKSQGHDVINLGIGSPDLMPPPQAIDAAISSLSDSKAHGYSSYRSSPELRSAISKWYQDIYGVRVDPTTEVLPLLGSKEGIFYLTMALVNPGEKVLCPNPGYLAYASAAKLAGGKAVYYNLNEESHWLPDLKQLESQDLSNCKLMWVNYPHMPTGASCDLAFFERLVEFAKKKNILICNDNPYGLVLNREKPLSILSADPKKDFVIELNSLSKSFNMPGWRVGMLLASRPWVDAVVKVKSNVDSGMFTPIQQGAISALSASKEWHWQRNQIYEKRREWVFKIFEKLSFKFNRDSVGLFVWAQAPDSISDVADFCDRLLTQCHLFVTPGFIFGSQGARYARASLCADEAVLKEALKRIERDFK